MLKLEKYSLGTGDRFGKEAEAQLKAVMAGANKGLPLAIVWNKSHREHTIIHTDPKSVRAAADSAVKNLDWKGGYHVDADHINLSNVDLFMDCSDFFTIDVADYTGQKPDAGDLQAFIENCREYQGELQISGMDRSIAVSEKTLKEVGEKFLLAVKEAGKIYRHIEAAKGKGNFITEVSMDETDLPQTPAELFFILKAIADEGIPLQTIAPKFTGRFNKGVDYVGDLNQFDQEFGEDILVIADAVKRFGLPENLKLSVHSGSDKFSIYPIISRHIRKYDAGLHIKTAGTTWLEELIGLAEGGGKGLEIAKEVYKTSLSRYDELAGPYATVIDIDQDKLPAPEVVDQWDSAHYVETLRHDQSNPKYNIHFRQLLHVGYKVAAEMGDTYLSALDQYEKSISRNVTENLLERHIGPLFLK